MYSWSCLAIPTQTGQRCGAVGVHAVTGTATAPPGLLLFMAMSWDEQAASAEELAMST